MTGHIPIWWEWHLDPPRHQTEGGNMSPINILLTLPGTNRCSKSTWKLIDFEFQEESPCGWMMKRCHLQAMGMERADGGSCKTPFIGSGLCTQIEKFCSKALLHGSIFPWAALSTPHRSDRNTFISVVERLSSDRSVGVSPSGRACQLEMKKKSMLQERRSLTDVQWLAWCPIGHEENWEARCNLKQQAWTFKGVPIKP